MGKKDELKRTLARRLSVKLGRPVRASEVLDRSEAAKLAGYHPNHWTNGFANSSPNYYCAPAFGKAGLFLYLREDVERQSRWNSEDLGWPDESFEPDTDDLIKFLGGWTGEN
jgi:hypothetical protein